MKNKKISNKIFRFFKFIYLKLFRINDSPQRIAIGFGLGVFTGILPGTGPLAALFLAFIFRVNRAAAFLASLATNTWLSILIFLLSIKAGSAIMKLNWHNVYQNITALFKDFNWQIFFKISVVKMLFPVILGYLIISFGAGLISYITVLVIINYIRKKPCKISKK